MVTFRFVSLAPVTVLENVYIAFAQMRIYLVVSPRNTGPLCNVSVKHSVSGSISVVK